MTTPSPQLRMVVLTQALSGLASCALLLLSGTLPPVGLFLTVVLIFGMLLTLVGLALPRPAVAPHHIIIFFASLELVLFDGARLLGLADHLLPYYLTTFHIPMYGLSLFFMLGRRSFWLLLLLSLLRILADALSYVPAHPDEWPFVVGAWISAGVLLTLAYVLGELQWRVGVLDGEKRALTLLAYQDTLTGLANRRQMYELLAAQTQPYAVVLLDIDHFKSVNDRYGHLGGDLALQELARLLQTQGVGTAARWGGEEFLVLLPHPAHHAAQEWAEKLRRAVARGEVRVGRTDLPPLRLTVSVGVTLARPGEDLDQVISRADLALYRSKRQGRDRVTQLLAGEADTSSSGKG